MFNEFDKIFDLIKKTGDRFIISENNQNYVIMSLEQYEKLIKEHNNAIEKVQGLTEDEMIERINQEIAAWRASQEEQFDWPYVMEKNREEGFYDSEDNYYLETID